MTVALNTLLSGFTTSFNSPEGEPGQDVPSSKVSFEELYLDHVQTYPTPPSLPNNAVEDITVGMTRADVSDPESLQHPSDIIFDTILTVGITAEDSEAITVNPTAELEDVDLKTSRHKDLLPLNITEPTRAFGQIDFAAEFPALTLLAQPDNIAELQVIAQPMPAAKTAAEASFDLMASLVTNLVTDVLATDSTLVTPDIPSVFNFASIGTKSVAAPPVEIPAEVQTTSVANQPLEIDVDVTEQPQPTLPNLLSSGVAFQSPLPDLSVTFTAPDAADVEVAKTPLPLEDTLIAFTLVGDEPVVEIDEPAPLIAPSQETQSAETKPILTIGLKAFASLETLNFPQASLANKTETSVTPAFKAQTEASVIPVEAPSFPVETASLEINLARPAEQTLPVDKLSANPVKIDTNPAPVANTPDIPFSPNRAAAIQTTPSPRISPELTAVNSNVPLIPLSSNSPTNVVQPNTPPVLVETSALQGQQIEDAAEPKILTEPAAVKTSHNIFKLDVPETPLAPRNSSTAPQAETPAPVTTLNTRLTEQRPLQVDNAVKTQAALQTTTHAPVSPRLPLEAKAPTQSPAQPTEIKLGETHTTAATPLVESKLVSRPGAPVLVPQTAADITALLAPSPDNRIDKMSFPVFSMAPAKTNTNAAPIEAELRSDVKIEPEQVKASTATISAPDKIQTAAPLLVSETTKVTLPTADAAAPPITRHIPASDIEIPKDIAPIKVMPAEDHIKVSMGVAPSGVKDLASPLIETSAPVFTSTSPQVDAQIRAVSSPTISAPPPISSMPPAVQAVADNLIKAVLSQSGVTIRLDPPEMGNVQISFQFDSERGVTAVVRSELVETSAFLKERAELLQQTLKNSGFDSVTLSFEQGSQSQSDQNFGQDTHKEAYFFKDDESAALAAPLATPNMTRSRFTQDHPVDIKL